MAEEISTEEIGYNKDCNKGLWIAINSEGNGISAPIIEKYEKYEPFTFKFENPGKVKVIFINLDNLDIEKRIFER